MLIQSTLVIMILSPWYFVMLGKIRGQDAFDEAEEGPNRPDSASLVPWKKLGNAGCRKGRRGE